MNTQHNILASNNPASCPSSNSDSAWNITAVWGPWGCIWRFLVFLAGLILFAFLLNWVKACNEKEDVAENEIEVPPPPPLVNYPVDSIPNVPELPDSANNHYPPVDSTAIVVNPDDSLFYIFNNQVFVFFNSKDIKSIKDDMKTFAQRFKQEYADSAYQIVYYRPEYGTMLLEVPPDSLSQVIDQLPKKITGINFMAFNNEVWTDGGKPSDPQFHENNYDEYFSLIQAYDAWDVTKGDSSVTVAVLDSYFNLANPEIGERYRQPVNIPKNNNQVQPPAGPVFGIDMAGHYSHGTHVAGIAIGGQDNLLGCSGIAPKCQWIPISVGDHSSTLSIVEGIMFAVYHRANVVNISLGADISPFTQLLPISDQLKIAKEPKKQEKLWKYILQTAEDHHCTIVTAAGNENVLLGIDVMNRDSLIVKVEWVDGKGVKSQCSNFGVVPSHDVDYQSIAAPGQNIWSASYKPALPVFRSFGYKVSVQDELQEMSGTSMASPCVAGAIALMKSKNKDLSTSDIIKILRITGKQTDKSGKIGPTIQIRDALDMVGGKKLNFNDVMKNHDLILGTWKSTEKIQLKNSVTGEKTDEIWSYFTFTSTTEGVIKDRCINTPVTYSADLIVDWKSKTIEISQTDNEKSDTTPVKYLGQYTYICKPDKSGLLEATCMENGQVQCTFYLEKVK